MSRHYTLDTGRRRNADVSLELEVSRDGEARCLFADDEALLADMAFSLLVSPTPAIADN